SSGSSLLPRAREEFDPHGLSGCLATLPMMTVGNMKVLVVEDGRTTRMMLKSAVDRLGHECLTAADGTEAWDLFRAEGADVIVSDWLMPGIEGPELCRMVRSNPGPYTYFVLLTAFGDRTH